MATYPYNRPGYEQWTDQPTVPEPTWTEGATGTAPAAQPPIDVVDNGVELWVYADLPGFEPEQISVSGDGTTLLISAERPAETEEGRSVIVHERSAQAERTVQLPAQVDVTSADMRYERGVCQIVLPKAESERFTPIEFDSD
mgnify:CR=1 FL=1